MNLHKRYIIIASVVAIAAIGAGTAAMFQQHQRSAKNPKSSSATQSAKISASGKPKDNTASTPKTTSGATANGSSNSSTAQNAACTALTPSAAKNLLGTDAASATPADLGVSQASNTEVTSCAYAADGNSIQLTIRTAKGSLGASQNATAFGSERPAGVTDVQGYGQSAYWDPGTMHLNVLSQNNWYIMSTSQNTQASAEAAAKLVEGL
jgi:cytoskeletal protein RodZ